MAIPTPADLRARFQEFKGLGETFLGRVIAEAARGVDPTAWGEREEDAILHLSGHLIETSPYGEDARIKPAGGDKELATTTYGARLLQMRKENTGRTFDARVL